MQGCDVRNAHDEVAADPQYPAHLVPDPEDFFHMLEHLIRDDEIDALIRLRKAIALQIH
jgi:hypothetical protein